MIPILLEELDGLRRDEEPVRIGVPLPRGLVRDAGALAVTDPAGLRVPHQFAPLAFWPDRSIKWLLVDVLARVAPRERAVLYVRAAAALQPESASQGPKLELAASDSEIRVDTGAACFTISRHARGPLASVTMGGREMLREPGTAVSLIDSAGLRHQPIVESLFIEEQGPIRVAIVTEGVFRGAGSAALQFRARTILMAGSDAVRIEYRVRNPRAALHAGGLWDLGDPRSCFVTDLSLQIFPAAAARRVHWHAEAPADELSQISGNWSLYQDSSGGDQWNSPNHVDHRFQPTVSFRGYRVEADGKLIGQGRRAMPVVAVECAGGVRIHAGVEKFWQNFPKALRVSQDMLQIGLFPRESRSGFEIQGGEQKRHTLFLDFASNSDASRVAELLRPVAVSLDAAWVESSRALTWFSARKAGHPAACEDYVGGMLDGPASVGAKREIIDEYGWRNFGDLYADHEAVRHAGDAPFISHYNNQYDFVFGACMQYLRSGDWRWHGLMADAAKHQLDIDIYHTQEDRAVFNGGLFWHTDHHKPAATCTHRTYSRHNGSSGYGGGPSNEHDYSSGLLYYYYLTGDREAAECVQELAEWVMAMDDGERNVFGVVDAGPTGAATKTRDDWYHQAGRGAGNSINTLLDAYGLTRERRYLTKAEQLVQRCIHPDDDVPALRLDEPESRWSYLVFLQVMGKYLAGKHYSGETDYVFHYARESLIRYARWMAEHEVPYKDVLHRVELPTETWSAHDIRKAHVFNVAASWSSGCDRERFRERACFFFERCLLDLSSFPTANMTRPQVILSVYGWIHDYFRKESAPSDDCSVHNHDFGRPVPFLSQRSRLNITLRARARVVVTEISRIVVDRAKAVRFGGRRAR